MKTPKVQAVHIEAAREISNIYVPTKYWDIPRVAAIIARAAELTARTP